MCVPLFPVGASAVADGRRGSDFNPPRVYGAFSFKENYSTC